MKLLVLYQAHDAAKDQPGYHEGFCRLVAEGSLEAHRAIPYLGVSEEKGWDGLWQEAYLAARDMQADAIFLQFFHGRIPDPSVGIKRLNDLPIRPTLFTSLGDPFGKWTHRVPPCFRIASQLSVITFLTGMGYLATQLVGWGSRNVVLMPHGCCQVRFANSANREEDRPEFDVTFIGSRMHARNPFGHCFRVDSKRAAFVQAFAKRYGKRFGLFGKGWEGNPSWRGPTPYAEQQTAMRRAHVVVGGLPNAYYDFYTSDREFIATSSGVPFVNYSGRGLKRLLQDGADWWLAESIEGMINLTDKLLNKSQDERLDLGAKTRAHILASHTQYHRCREMVQIVEAVRNARLAGGRATAPVLSFLSCSTTAVDPGPPAILGWVG